jgi:hypothetical protein
MSQSQFLRLERDLQDETKHFHDAKGGFGAKTMGVENQFIP